MTSTLFDVTAADVAVTGDDWYTPRWLFDAAAITFDMDVSAPVDPAYRTCPALQYLTVVEDGLTAQWDGVVWMNPPYSRPGPWVDRWAAHPSGLALTLIPRDARWLGVLLRAADAITMPSAKFQRPGCNEVAGTRFPLVMAARGAVCVEALSRVAASDKIMSGAYHVRLPA